MSYNVKTYGRKKGMQPLDWISIILLVIGGIVHLGQAFNFYAVDVIFRGLPFLGKLVYFLVGVSGIYGLFFLIKRAIKA